MSGIAIPVKGTGDQITYKVVPPVEWTEYGFDGDQVARQSDHVWVSAVNNMFAHETYIFPATPEGTVIDWMELEGSAKNTMSHAEVLTAAGYTIVQPEDVVEPALGREAIES